MKFCPVVPEICRGQVHDPGKKENNNNKKRCLGDLISANQRLLWHLATMLDNRS